MSTFETIIYEKQNGVAYVTLNRPKSLNAYSIQMRDDLFEVLGAVKDDPDIRVVIFSGTGEKAFCAGADLENVTAIENRHNLQPSPEVIAGLSGALDLPIEDIYAAIADTLEDYPWEKPREIDLRDAELELMFMVLSTPPRRHEG